MSGLLQPDVWRTAWRQRLTYPRGDDPQLPVAARTFLSAYGMPSVVIFEWRNSFEISFAPLAGALAPYSTRVRWGDFYNAIRDGFWRQEIVIAAEDFCNCNGSVSFCIHRDDGVVSRIDCQLLKEPQSFVNGSVELFGLSLLAAKQWSDDLQTRGVPPTRDSYAVLESTLREIDPQAFASADHFWRNFLEVVLDEPEIEMEITNDPARSRPRN